MNILLTCAGRLNYMVRCFREALQGRGQVLACDTSPDAPALQEADLAFVVPPIEHATYIDTLLAICSRHAVRLLIPAHDLELPILARHTARFQASGTLPLVAPLAIIDLCADKWASNTYLAAHGIEVPRTYLSMAQVYDALASGTIAFPLVIKPRRGSGSLNIEYATDLQELELTYTLVAKRTERAGSAATGKPAMADAVLIQEYLAGQEYGLDVVNDLECRYVCTFVRRKRRMRAGQTDRAVAVHDERLEQLGRLIGTSLGHSGLLDCDVIVRSGTQFVLDLNPRIGGGYPYSQIAGANFPAALLAWIERKEPDPQWFSVRPNVMVARSDCFFVVDGASDLTVARLDGPPPEERTGGHMDLVRNGVRL